MKYRMLELTMSVLFIVSVYITVSVALPTVGQNKGNIYYESQNDYEQISFSDKIVVLDSGHGGIDGGKQAASGVLEKDINLSVAYKLKEKLEETGIKVIMTRTDESDNNKKVADMKKRCEIIDQSNANVVISIHQNSFESASVNGAQVFYYKHSAEGKKLATLLQASLKEELNPDNKRVEKANDTYYMLIHTKYPTVIAECGFLSNPKEAELLSSNDYQQKVADALYSGIIEYLMLK